MKLVETEKRPSFNDTTMSIRAGETKVIEDTNGEFSKYSSINVEKDGVRFVHNKGENTMTISVNKNANTESLKISDTTFKSWGLIKEGTEDLDTNIFFELEDDIQNQLYALNYNDPVSLNLSLQVELFGRLELQKLDSNGKLINGATFNVKGENFNQDVKVTNGKIIIEKLRKEVYCYNKERILCDIIKGNNTGIDKEQANKFIKETIGKNKIDTIKLIDYAKKLKCEEKVRNIMEVFI